MLRICCLCVVIYCATTHGAISLTEGKPFGYWRENAKVIAKNKADRTLVTLIGALGSAHCDKVLGHYTDTLLMSQ